MRVIHVTTEPPIPGRFTGGMGCHVWNVAKEQVKLGHEVTVYCPIKGEESHEGVLFKSWAYHVPKFEHECAFQIEAARRTVSKIYSEVKENRPDIIHCHEWDSAPVTMDLAQFLDVPCVATLHLSNTLNAQYMTPHHTELNNYYLWWEQEMMRRADGVVAISSHYANWIKLFNQGSPVKLIHNGVSIEDFQGGPEVARLHDQPLLAFFHGRLCGQKGLGIIAEAAKNRDDIYWAIAGPMAAKEDGRCLEDGIYSDLLALEREGKVEVLGMLSQPEIGSWLRACDVAVYPHLRAPFDCAVLEAMACGALVITTGVDAIGEYAFDGVNCRYCRPTADSLLETIDSALSLNAYCKINARKVAEEYTWKNTTKKTVEFYEEIINGKNSFEFGSARICDQNGGILLDCNSA